MNALSEIEMMLDGDGTREEQIAATHRGRKAARELRKRWATLNEMVPRRQGFGLSYLAAAKYPGWKDVSWCFERRLGLDHPSWYWRDWRPAVMVVEPYRADELPDLRAHVASFGLELHTPPNPFASFHHPGHTVFAAIAREGSHVRWLDVQLSYDPGPLSFARIRDTMRVVGKSQMDASTDA